jgi:hypothetical protein
VTGSTPDLYRWCRDRAEAFRDYEHHEMALWPTGDDRDTAIVEWVVRCLGNPNFEAGAEVLAILAERRAAK